MAEEEESFENLDDLDWSDVESELKANRDQILSEVKSEGEVEHDPNPSPESQLREMRKNEKETG